MSVLTKKYFDTPKVIQIEITNRCPYNCAGCYKSKKTKDMNLDVFRKVINEAVTINVKSIMFNGGEPMVVENLKEMINYVNHRIPITIFTSGYNIDEKWIDFFMVHNVRLYISINGSTDQVNSLSRDGYSIAMTAMKLIRKSKYPYYINWVARNDNIYDFPNLIELAKYMKVTGVNIVANKLDGNGGIQSPLTKTDYNFLINTIRNEKDCVISIQRCFGTLIQEMGRGMTTFLDGCQAGISACAVMLDGSYQPCTHLNYPEAYDDIFSYWSRSPILEFLRRFKTPSLTHCEKCSKNKFCSFCRAMSANSHNNLKNGYEECPLYEKQLK